MTKQEQDKRWAQLSEESKKYFIDKVAECQRLIKTPSPSQAMRDEWRGLIQGYENVFGSHNLKPKPETPKTWEDVENECGDIIEVCLTEDDFYSVAFSAIHFSNILGNKLIATIKIAKLIELGYGGMIADKDWENYHTHKYCIILNFNGNPTIECRKGNIREFIAFHTKQQAKEFMSYPENVELIKQYHMI